MRLVNDKSIRSIRQWAASIVLLMLDSLVLIVAVLGKTGVGVIAMSALFSIKLVDPNQKSHLARKCTAAGLEVPS